MSRPLAIVDYGVGNLRSAQKAFEHLGQAAEITGDPDRIASAPAVVLPGQGAFGTCMHNLTSAGLVEPVLHAARSGRPFLVYDVKIKQARIGTFDVELIHDFLLALVNQAGMNLHVRMLSGRNPHHIIEATFKGLARALDHATQRDPRVRGVPSTKGTLDG